MAFWDERSKPSWSLIVLFTLAIAGCGGESGGSGTAANTPNQTDAAVTSGNQDIRQPVEENAGTDQSGARSGEAGKAVANGGHDAPAQVVQPGQVVDNPILADPIQVPVPEGEQTDAATGDTDKPKDDPVDRDAPDVTKPEPEQPKPVADRPTLQWDSPLTRVDGSKLYPGEISGFRVYYRLRHQDDYQSLLLEGPDADHLVLDNFKPGAYEFAVSTIDVDGLESRRSAPVSIDLI